MGVIISISSVLFGVLCALLIVIILLQSDKSAGMGILGGSSQSTFGSSTADVITKITTVMVALFMLGALGLSIVESYRSRSLEKDLLSTEEGVTSVIEGTEKSPERGAEKAGEKPPVAK